MSAVAASPRAAHPLRGTRQPAPPIERGPDDRWIGARSARHASALMSFILMASVATHAGLVATAFWADRSSDVPPPKEISVEVVQEPAKPQPPKPQAAAQKGAASEAKQGEAKAPEAAKPEAKQSEPAKSETKPSAQIKPEPAKLQQTKPEQTKPEQTKREAAKAQPQKAPLKMPPKPRTTEHPAKGEDLRKQLDGLRAQYSALATKHETPKPTPAQPVQPKTAPNGSARLASLLGEPPPGMAAAALPSESADGTEAVSYQSLVMSKVAKSKKEGRYQGTPGFATIAFLLGDKGEVVTTKIEHESGDKWLDKEAVDMIARGAPYPPPPPGAERAFVVTLEFSAGN